MDRKTELKDYLKPTLIDQDVMITNFPFNFIRKEIRKDGFPVFSINGVRIEYKDNRIHLSFSYQISTQVNVNSLIHVMLISNDRVVRTIYRDTPIAETEDIYFLTVTLGQKYNISDLKVCMLKEEKSQEESILPIPIYCSDSKKAVY